MKLTRMVVVPYTRRLRSPLVTGVGQLSTRRGMLLGVELGGGARGWGEAAPLAGHTRDTFDDATARLRVLCRDAVGAGADDVRQAIGEEANRLPSVVAAVDTAIASAQAASTGVSLARFLGSATVPRSVPVNVLITAESPEAVSAAARVAAERGFRTYKLKVGATEPAMDVARINALLGAVAGGVEVEVRLDANSAWDPDTAVRVLEGVNTAVVQYLEDPVATGEEAMVLAERIDVPLAVDMGVNGVRDIGRVADFASFVVLKPSAIGGPTRTLQVAEAAVALGMDVVVSSLLETAVGLTAALHVVAAAPGRLLAAGLGTADLFVSDLGAAPRVEAGRMQLPRTSGLGIALSDEVASQLAEGGVR